VLGENEVLSERLLDDRPVEGEVNAAFVQAYDRASIAQKSLRDEAALLGAGFVPVSQSDPPEEVSGHCDHHFFPDLDPHDPHDRHDQNVPGQSDEHSHLGNTPPDKNGLRVQYRILELFPGRSPSAQPQRA